MHSMVGFASFICRIAFLWIYLVFFSPHIKTIPLPISQTYPRKLPKFRPPTKPIQPTWPRSKENDFQIRRQTRNP